MFPLLSIHDDSHQLMIVDAIISLCFIKLITSKWQWDFHTILNLTKHSWDYKCWSISIQNKSSNCLWVMQYGVWVKALLIPRNASSWVSPHSILIHLVFVGVQLIMQSRQWNHDKMMPAWGKISPPSYPQAWANSQSQRAFLDQP